MTTSKPSQRTMFDDGPSDPLLPTPAVLNGGRGWSKGTVIRGNSAYAPNGRKEQIHLHHVAEVPALSSRLATPASPSPTPGSGPARTTPGTSGRGLLPLLRTSDPLGSFWKTFLGTSAWGSTACSLTWKASATPAGRLLFRLLASARSTGGTASGSSPALLPTPTAFDSQNCQKGPEAKDYDANRRARGGNGGPSKNLREVAHQPGMKLNPEFVCALMGYPQFWMDDLPPDPLG